MKNKLRCRICGTLHTADSRHVEWITSQRALDMLSTEHPSSIDYVPIKELAYGSEHVFYIQRFGNYCALKDIKRHYDTSDIKE